METLGIGAPALLQEIASHTLLDDLVIVNGPILSLYKDREGGLVIYDWCDQGDQFNRWACYPVTQENFDLFVNGKISLRTLQQTAVGGLCCIVDFDGSWRAHNVSVCQLSALPKNYLPSEDYYYHLTPRVYRTYHELARSRAPIQWTSYAPIEAVEMPSLEIATHTLSLEVKWKGTCSPSAISYV